MLNGISSGTQPSRKIPGAALLAIRRASVPLTRYLLVANVTSQRMCLFVRAKEDSAGQYHFRQSYLISTSLYGIGQEKSSNQTPLGLHRIAIKVGAGRPIGTIYRSRKVAGLTWQGQPDGAIVHRILWLEGLESGRNRGGNVDSFERYIYIHGFGDETTLGRPRSHGCIHMAAADLIPLFDRVPIGTLLWIGQRGQR